MEKILILMMGLPRSGKSTVAATLRVTIPNSAIVEPDAVRLAMHGERYIEAAEHYVWATSYTMAEALFRAGTDCVIVDSTNMNAGARKNWLRRFGHLNDVSIHVMYVNTPREVCIATQAGIRAPRIAVAAAGADAVAAAGRADVAHGVSREQ